MLVLVASIAMPLLYAAWYWYRPLTISEDTFLVPHGSSLKAVARRLADSGALSEPNTFVWIATLTGRRQALKSGEYRFQSGMSAAAILDHMVKGRVIEYPFVIVEGWNIRQVLSALQQAPRLEQTLKGLTPGQIMAKLGRPGEHPEGRFFPDTYRYTGGQTDLSILQRAHRRMDERLSREWEKRRADIPVKTPYEALILASIVEKETGKPEERPMIAGVFVNRLRLNMKLQTDPTVIYGLGERFDGNIRKRDLLTDTPYNTYTRKGLPPTPIAMPGGEAIRATLNPADTRALYFVSRGDGSHVFSDNLNDHNQAVIKFQLKGRARPFSSYPAPAPKPGP
jgi:UPF0755 protein